MDISARPSEIIWDITYACPLRCVHCYSESGRRPTRQLGLVEQLAIADAMISMNVPGIALAGGEPLLVRGIDQVAERFTSAGVAVSVYTGGWFVDRALLERMVDVVDRIVVSLDGPTAAVHDAIRGRAGSFDRAVATLTALNEIAHERRDRGEKVPFFGIDCVVVRSNFDTLAQFCAEVVPRFDELRVAFFGAAVPGGLASRADFADQELLDDVQLSLLDDREHRSHLQSLVSTQTRVATYSNAGLMMHPTDPRRGARNGIMQVEPDGAVRAMAIYEGTVGSLLTDPPESLWQRALAQRSDPFVVEALSGVRTMSEWAAAIRRIDQHFGTDAVRARIENRPAYQSVLATGAR